MISIKLMPFIFLAFQSTLPEIQAGRHEKRLLQRLFDGEGEKRHNPMERPVENETQVLYVWFKVSLQQIIDVDEKNQILFANIWLDLTWTDYHFRWDPAEYGGVQKINVDPKRVWKPDILLYNSADEKFDATYPTNVVISHTGQMAYIPPGMFRSTCKIDITWFPFDTQVCNLKFGSWSYDGGSVDLRFKCPNESFTEEHRLNDPNNCSISGAGDISTYIPSGEWNLEEVPGIRHSNVYDCCPHPFIDLEFFMRIRRRKLYYIFNLIAPCSFLACLALLSFIIPPDAGEKVSFDMPGERSAIIYDCCPHPFIDLRYQIKIRRRTLYYGFNLIIPCVLISSMALLTFILPPDAGEKISLGVTIMLSQTMFQLLVADAMPQTSEAVPLIGVTILLSLTVFLMMVAEAMPPTSDAVPVIGMYFACTMIMCSLSVVFTVIVLNYHHRDAESHPVPNWVKKLICTYLAAVLCMRNPTKTREASGRQLRSSSTRSSVAIRRKRSHDFSGGYSAGIIGGGGGSGGGGGGGVGGNTFELRERSSKSLLANVLDLDDDIRVGGGFSGPPTYFQNYMGVGVPSPSTNGHQQSQQPPPHHQCSTRGDLSAVLHELRVITKKISDDIADNEISSDWKFAARVVDRLCLITFSCFTVVSTCAILFSAPDVFKG